jgi:hypothetical protein
VLRICLSLRGLSYLGNFGGGGPIVPAPVIARTDIMGCFSLIVGPERFALLNRWHHAEPVHTKLSSAVYLPVD